MAEDTTPLAPTEPQGITDAGPATEQTTGTDSTGTVSGQAGQPPTDTRTSGTEPAPESSFADPSELPPELQTAYKRLQGSYTKKMQQLSQQAAAQRQKIEAYDAFSQDPIGSMQRMASQYGYKLSRAEAAQALQSAEAGGTQNADWTPNTWDEVVQRVREQVVTQVAQQFQPILQNVQAMRAQTIERQLDEIDPEWRTYEDDMRQALQTHPTLVSDVGKLYRLSVPDEVIERRATQKALKKFESKAQSARVGGTTGTQPKTAEALPAVESFDDAVKAAKAILAQQQGRR